MSIKGRSSTWFRHALESGSPARVRATAAELDAIALADALAICFVFCLRDPHAYPRAAARWVGRLALEQRVGLQDLAIALEALAALEGEHADAAAELLAERCRSWGVHGSAGALEIWQHLRG